METIDRLAKKALLEGNDYYGETITDEQVSKPQFHMEGGPHFSVRVSLIDPVANTDAGSGIGIYIKNRSEPSFPAFMFYSSMDVFTIEPNNPDYKSLYRELQEHSTMAKIL